MAVKGGDGKGGLHNKRLGLAGERKARAYLRLHGWKILNKNYKNPYGEVDIIAEKGGVVAFIEVKTRLSENYGAPSEASSNAVYYGGKVLFFKSGNRLYRAFRYNRNIKR